MHQPFENLSDRQIKKVRAQAKSKGPGMLIEKIPRHSIRIQQHQLDHFLEFIMRPFYYQDVAYCTRAIKLESGEEFVIPNVVQMHHQQSIHGPLQRNWISTDKQIHDVESITSSRGHTEETIAGSRQYCS